MQHGWLNSSGVLRQRVSALLISSQSPTPTSLHVSQSCKGVYTHTDVFTHTHTHTHTHIRTFDSAPQISLSGGALECFHKPLKQSGLSFSSSAPNTHTHTHTLSPTA